PLIHLISSKNRAQEFSTSLTSEVHLSSPHDGIWDADGTIQIDQLQVQRGIKEFHTNEPISIRFEKGNLEAKKFLLRGDNTYLEVSSQKIPKYPITLDLNGKIDIGLLSFLTPFLDDVKGVLALTSKVSMGSSDWDIEGSGFVTQGFIHSAALP